jgi:ubiquitin carboxyl-terminal hydrolase 8
MKMDLSKYHTNGLTGIENVGNTCFMNACIQVLNHTYELHHFLDSKKYSTYLKENLEESTIISEWNDLRQIMWSGNGVVTPNKFINAIQKIAKHKNREVFTGFSQNDMPEFLMFVLDCIHDSISRTANITISGKAENKKDKLALECYKVIQKTYSTEYSEILDLFYGIMINEILSVDGKKKHSIKPEFYFILDLPIIEYLFDGQQVHCRDLYDCINLYHNAEELVGDNAWYNEKSNKKEDIKKQSSFWNFPKILVITLKRFSPDGETKMNHCIDFPLDNMDLSKYVCGYNAKSFIYDLYGVCNHIGGVSGGHYTAIVRNIKGEWIHYNDNIIEKIENPREIINPMAYCLFYRKKNNLV